MKVHHAPQPILTTVPRKQPVPQDISAEYVEARESTQEEPPNLKGVVYLQAPSGDTTVLQYSGQTTPALPPDIPASAVNKEGRVVIYVDGIHQEMSEQKRQIKYFMHGQGAGGADLGQSVVAIHEGAGKSGFRDGLRIAKVLGMLKLVQNRVVPLQWASKQIYTIDPAIKSVHDEVKQSLLAGRKVQLISHSGGGAEVATALTLLAREGMKEKIADNVRLLSTASAAAHKDFTKAGLKADNILYTGSHNDPVYYLFRHYLGPLSIPSAVGFVADLGRYVYHLITDKTQQTAYHFHSPDYIFAQNAQTDSQRIQKFLDGGPGGKYPLP